MRAGDGTKLGAVIRKYSTIKVEDYQRTYSWDNDDVDDFLGDLIDAMDPAVISHFFGTLIFQELKDENGVVAVVDGQQRLTTAFLTIAAIRDAVMKLGEDTIPAKAYGLAPERPAEEATRLLVSEYSTKFRFEANRFVKPIVDSSVFNPPKLQTPIKTNHKKVTLSLRHAVRRIRARIASELEHLSGDAEKLIHLNALLKTLTDKFIVLSIETSSLSESLDVFLTLNDRGQELGPSDIVKGKLMAALGRPLADNEQLDLQDKINRDWQELVDDVQEPESFLRHYLIATGVVKVQKKLVVNMVEARLQPRDGLTESQVAEMFWQDLKNGARRYCDIIKASLSDDIAKTELSLLEGLQKSHRIFLLALFERPDLMSKGVIEKCIHLIFALSFRWAAAEKGRQLLEDKFHDLAMSTRGVSKKESEILERLPLSPEDLLKRLEKMVEDIDVDFHKTFRKYVDGSFIARAALYYSQKLTAGNAISHALKDLHLEHIAPQKATQTWLEEVFSGDQTEYDRYEDVITSIGNLTLLDPGLNTKLLNKPFSEKKAEYAKSSMFLTTNLKDFELWGEELIAERTRWIAQTFEIVCSPEQPPKSVKPFTDWYKDLM